MITKYFRTGDGSLVYRWGYGGEADALPSDRTCFAWQRHYGSLVSTIQTVRTVERVSWAELSIRSCRATHAQYWLEVVIKQPSYPDGVFPIVLQERLASLLGSVSDWLDPLLCPAGRAPVHSLGGVSISYPWAATAPHRAVFWHAGAVLAVLERHPPRECLSLRLKCPQTNLASPLRANWPVTEMHRFVARLLGS